MQKQFFHVTILSAALLGCSSPSSTDVNSTSALPPALPEPVYEAPTDPSAPLPGHSTHGVAFNKGPRQAARWMDGKTGDVSFPIKTESEEAQQFFNQGIGQLHGFWTLEAERSFRQVLKLDPDNPMAYWGMAMANGTNSRAKEFAEKAVKYQERADDKGRLWIAARAAFQKESDKKKREAAYLKALQAISTKYPEDVEAKAFVVLQMYRNGVRGKKTSHYESIDKLISEILKVNPVVVTGMHRVHFEDFADELVDGFVV